MAFQLLRCHFTQVTITTFYNMLHAHSILTFPLSFADTVTTARRLIRSVAGPVTTILSCGLHCFRRGLGFLRFIWFASC